MPARKAVESDRKTCRLCEQDKAKSEFTPYKQDGRTYHRSYCKPCATSHNRAYLAAVPGRNLEVHRRNKLKTNYGITPGDYDAILEAQGGVCSLCASPDPGGRWGRFHVDHDHATGAVRSLTCNCCNVGLGMFKDNPALMRRAAAYVEHHAAQS